MNVREFLSATMLSTLLSTALAFGSPVAAADAPKAKATESAVPLMAGTWKGSIAGQLEVIFHLTAPAKAGEAWSGTFDVPLQNVKGFALEKISVDGSSINFNLGGVPGDARYEGKLSDDGSKFTGQFRQGPVDVALELTKAKAEAPMTKPTAPAGSEKVDTAKFPLAGSWRGKVGGQLEIIFRLSPPAKEGEAWSGAFDVPVQNVKGFALEKIAVDGKSVKFSLGGVPGDARYEGTLSDDGKKIDGRYRQATVDVPMELTKDAVKTSAVDSKKIDEVAEKLLKDWKAPGLALAVVQDGKIIHAAGYGYKNVERKEPMTADTLLAIGSCTKAFTTAVIASLVEQGKLDWDRPVHEYWPEFRIVNPATTQFVTLRDMVTHRTGLPRHDLMWFAGQLPREEILKRVEHLAPAAPIRQKWIYNNIMYVTAAAAAERATGKSWETLVRETILDPLGMKRTKLHIAEMTSDPDHAKGYHNEDKAKDGFLVKPYREIAGMAPAGSINSSAREMAAWIALQLGHGPKMADGREILKKTTIKELHAPQMIASGSAVIGERADVQDLGYGMGWGSESDRSKRVVRHGGAIDGFVAQVVLYPDDGLGLVALVNQSGSALPGLACKTVADMILDRNQIDWSAEALAKVAAAKAATSSAKTEKAKSRVADTKPSHSLKDYAGTFVNPAFGKLEISAEGNALKLAYGIVSFPLEHWHYDVFSAKDVKPEDDAFENKLFQFQADVDGSIVSVSSDFEPMIPPVVFTRAADAKASDPAFLDTLAGEYELATQLLRIERQGTVLQAILPGQPTYRLKPSRGLQFDFEGLTGFRMKFEQDADGKTTGVSIEQPNGTFKGKRKGD